MKGLLAEPPERQVWAPGLYGQIVVFNHRPAQLQQERNVGVHSIALIPCGPENETPSRIILTGYYSTYPSSAPHDCPIATHFLFSSCTLTPTSHPFVSYATFHSSHPLTALTSQGRSPTRYLVRQDARPSRLPLLAHSFRSRIV